jgi:hypothetical protein
MVYMPAVHMHYISSTHSYETAKNRIHVDVTLFTTSSYNM